MLTKDESDSIPGLAEAVKNYLSINETIERTPFPDELPK